MATRVTATEVKVIIQTSLDDSNVEEFINLANLIVTEDLASLGMSDGRLTEIEKWLSAHFVSMREKGAREKEKVGQSSSEYKGTLGQNLAFTRYGQQAMIIDSSGTLAKMSTVKQASARFDSIDFLSTT